MALMRKSGRSASRVLSVRTSDRGLHWSPLAPTSLANPDAAVFAVRSQSGDLVLAFNDSELDRANLSLAVSDDGGVGWEVVRVIEPPERTENPRLAYPWLLQASNGVFHLFYTWDRRRIVHVRFNRAWLLRNR